MITEQIRTTDGTIALINLEAQIESLERQAAPGRLASRWWGELIDRIALRGQILGRIADYERAAALGEQIARDASDGLGFMARARARALLHRFKEALTDIDVAASLGVADAEVEAERAAIFQAVGRYDEAMALRRTAVERRADFETLWVLAALHAERGDIDTAEHLFGESRKHFRGVSPFGLAQLEAFNGGRLCGRSRATFDARREWLTLPLAGAPTGVRAGRGPRLPRSKPLPGEWREAADRLRHSPAWPAPLTTPITRPSSPVSSVRMAVGRRQICGAPGRRCATMNLMAFGIQRHSPITPGGILAHGGWRPAAGTCIRETKFRSTPDSTGVRTTLAGRPGMRTRTGGVIPRDGDTRRSGDSLA